MKEDINNVVGQVLEMLSQIDTKGNNTILMASCIISLRSLLERINQEPNHGKEVPHDA